MGHQNEMKTAGYDRERYKPGYKGKFVIGLHDADKAGKHWDVRIQMPLSEGGTTYRSFVNRKRKTPSGDTKVYMPETEDHTPQQAHFEGTIPDGEYGAGTAKIWDKGTYELVEAEGDKKYVMDFHGEKLKGSYALVKYKNGFLWVKVKNKQASAVVGMALRIVDDLRRMDRFALCYPSDRIYAKIASAEIELRSWCGTVDRIGARDKLMGLMRSDPYADTVKQMFDDLSGDNLHRS